MGPKVIQAMQAYFGSPDTRKIVDDLLREVQVVSVKSTLTSRGSLTRKKAKSKKAVNSTEPVVDTAPELSPVVIPVAETTSLVPFAGRVVVLTGKLEAYARNDAKAIIETLGGEVANSVTKRVNLLVVGSDKQESSSSKLDKAKKQSIEVWGEDDFLAALESAGYKKTLE